MSFTPHSYVTTSLSEEQYATLSQDIAQTLNIVFIIFTTPKHRYKYKVLSTISIHFFVFPTIETLLLVILIFHTSNIMPGHDHSFQEMFPQAGLQTRETFLS